MSSAQKTGIKSSDAEKNVEVANLPKVKRAAGPLKQKPDGSLVDRLKKSGLDPQRLLDLSLPRAAGAGAPKRRHQIVVLGFLIFALVPSAFFSAYMFLLASDQYHSVAAFAVRSSSSAPATEILGMVLDSGGESTTSNSYIVNDYLQSQAILDDLSANIDLNAVFNRDGADWLFKMGEDLPIEDKLRYWNKMVDVNFDSTSGVMYVEVRSFHPDDSVQIAEEILVRSDILVNKLSEANRRQMVKFAEEAVARAEARLKVIQKQMLAYREETQEVSPEENARLAASTIARLDQQVSAKAAEKSTLMNYLDEGSPRIRILSEQIGALKAQIEVERKKLGGGADPSADATSRGAGTISFRIADYSELSLEEEFARQLYTTALAGLEQARSEADSKQLYLATFIHPTLSQAAQYPGRFMYSLSVFLILSGSWLVVVLLYYNVRDRT